MTAIIGGATALAEACVTSNVKRMIFKSIKVNGETSDERVLQLIQSQALRQNMPEPLAAEHQLLTLSEKD